MDSLADKYKGDAKIEVKKGDLKRWEKFLATAHQMMSDKEYGKCLSYFAYVIHHAPQFRDQIHNDFLFALQSWCCVLEDHEKAEELVKCLNEARKLFPNSAVISNHVGSGLFRLNMFDEAAVYFRRALTLDPGLSNAQENLDSVANLLVERWHFRMLNDKLRNQAYKGAIQRAVASGCESVLDIGSGTGILSMYAVESGAKEVFACEMSKTMFDLSKAILQYNKMQDHVHVFNKKSFDLKVPDDLPRRVSLIVTETLDCGLLGEGIVHTMTHAQRELITSHHRNPESSNDVTVNGYKDSNMATKVIPEGATVYGRLIQSEKIREYARVKPIMLDLDLGSVNIQGAEISEKCQEPYTTEEMSCVTHTALSEPFHIMTYDFRTPENYTEDSKMEVRVPVVHSGSLDAIVTWFDLKLDSVETISSAPGCSVCWEQAVYPIGLGSGVGDLDPGDDVILDCKLTSGAIYVEIDHMVKRQSMINIKYETTQEKYVLPFSEISKLNDTEFNENFQGAILEVFTEIDSTLQQRCGVGSRSGCLVLCDSPTFNPLYASSAGFSSVLCISQETDFDNCLEVLRTTNHLPDTLHFTDRKLDDPSNSGQWNLLVVDPIETSGVLRRQVIQDIVFAKGCVLSKDVGIVLPRKIELWGMLINSDSLCRKSHVVNNDVTLGLDIARFMNEFQVKNQVDVDVTSNPYIPLTEPTRLLTLDFTTPADDDDSLLGLLHVTRDVHVTATKDGCVDGLMYWFVLGFSEERRLNTGPQGCSHFNQVVIVFKEKLKVSCGEMLLVRTSCKNSCITASVQRS